MNWNYKIIKKRMIDGRKNHWCEETHYWLWRSKCEFYFLDEIKNGKYIVRSDIYVFKAPLETWDETLPRFTIHIKQYEDGRLFYDKAKFSKELVEHIINSDDWKVGYHPLIEEVLQMYSYYQVKGLYHGWEWKKRIIEHKYSTIIDWFQRLQLESYILSISDKIRIFKVEDNKESQYLFKENGFFKVQDFKVKKMKEISIKRAEANKNWEIIYHPLVGEEI